MTHYPNRVSTVHKGKEFSCTLGDFRIDAKLARPAAINGQDWKDSADQWAITLYRGNDAAVTLDYWTGVGHRKYPAGCMRAETMACALHLNPSIFDIEHSVANKPCAFDILDSLVMDSHCHIEARDYEYPEDYYMSELGYESVKTAQDIAQGCKNSFNLLKRLGLDESAIYTLTAELRDDE